jgi:hypothetical protein
MHGTYFLNTLRLDGAEDRALPGGNLSADSGAKTRGWGRCRAGL